MRTINRALASTLIALEDAIPRHLAAEMGLEAIVTRHRRDYRVSNIAVVTAEECLSSWDFETRVTPWCGSLNERPQAHELEDPAQVDAWRTEACLPELAIALQAQSDPRPTPAAYAAKQEAGLSWARQVGWVE